MDKILGLGRAGCNIASLFEKYPQYMVKKIDTETCNDPNYIKVFEQDSPENYELFCPNLSYELADMSGELLFVVCGASLISGASLGILSQIKDLSEISVLYIKPDMSHLNKQKKLQENLVCNVFQEYARSGLFKQVYIVDNNMIEAIIGDVPIVEYYDRINELIVTTIHMVNVFNHSEPVVSTTSEPHEIARISTLGVVDIEKKEEKLFFLLDELREKQYYCAIPDERLKTDGTLLKKIKEIAKDSTASYGVYSTTYDNEYVYCVARSSVVQQETKT